MKFRKISESDIERVVEIMRQAKEQMHREGKNQWQLGDDSYPSRADIAGDVQKGIGLALEDEGRIVAYAAVVYTGEPAYESIDGAWLSEQPYVVVHRLAVADEAKGRGMAQRFLDEVCRLAKAEGVCSFKIDTNHDNFYMQHILAKLGFTHCGEITYPKGTRLAFEKLL